MTECSTAEQIHVTFLGEAGTAAITTVLQKNVGDCLKSWISV